MTCPKCGAKLQETSLVCLNCKTFVLPNIPRKAEAAEPVVPEAKPSTDVFKNLMNFVQAETPSRETASHANRDGNYTQRENSAGQAAEPNINLRQFGARERETAPPQTSRKPRIQRFGSEDVVVAEEAAPAADPVTQDIEQDQADMDASEPDRTASPKNRSRRLLIGGGSAIIFIALAIVYYLYFYN